MRATPALLATLALATAALGCLPQVGHGPRVEPGTSYHITGSLTRSTEVRDHDRLPVLPSIYAGGTHGWVWENGVAASLGLQLPLLLPFGLFATDAPFDTFLSLLVADAYVQPARSTDGGLDYGVGAMFSRSIVAPYLQFGQARDGGIYTTQLLAYSYGDFSPYYYWMPALARRATRADGTRTVDYYLRGAVGWPREEIPGCACESVWFISVGVALGFPPGR